MVQVFMHTSLLMASKINEVILSGGDPLSLSDEKLAQLIKGIVKQTHIKLT
jgi:L-lysine 2,3-aminomutase